jgi:hypothetical protein
VNKNLSTSLWAIRILSALELESRIIYISTKDTIFPILNGTGQWILLGAVKIVTPRIRQILTQNKDVARSMGFDLGAPACSGGTGAIV